jgi:hypothetical protein
MDPEIDEVGRSDYKTGIGYVKELKCQVVLDLRLLLFLYEGQS